MEDRRIKYLDKVVDFLVKDTKVDYEERELFFPFTQKIATRRNTDNSTPFHKILFHKDSVIPIGGFMEYIEEIYGITYIKDVSYVWGKYKDVMRYIVFGNDPTNEPIYESEDKEKKLLDRILKYLMDDTIVDHRTGEITFPFFLQVLPPMPRKFFDFRSTSNYNFSDYCKKTYGLNDEEVIYLWSRYKDLFSDEVFGRNSINESDDKKQVYLNKIVDWLVRDTEVGGHWFNPPYYYPGSSAGRTGFRSVYEHTFGLSTNNTYSGLDSQLIYFDHYCKNNYGLTGEETKIVWYEYMKKLKESYDWGF